MKKSLLVVALIVSAFSFCTKDNSSNPTGVSSASGYTDSIVVDLYSYSIWFFKHNIYFGPITMTQQGKTLLKTPLDSNMKSYNSGSTTYPVFTPKYTPSKFEAFVYDSIPLIESDSLNPGLLVSSYGFSRSYFYSLDATPLSDTVENVERGITRPDVFYIYGVGLYVDFAKFGLGTIKIYYK